MRSVYLAIVVAAVILLAGVILLARWVWLRYRQGKRHEVVLTASEAKKLEYASRELRLLCQGRMVTTMPHIANDRDRMIFLSGPELYSPPRHPEWRLPHIQLRALLRNAEDKVPVLEEIRACALEFLKEAGNENLWVRIVIRPMPDNTLGG